MAETADGLDDVLPIGKYILAGELRNTRRNGVFGWFQFAADFVIRIELTGNFPAKLLEAGWNHFRFETARFNSAPLPEPEDLPEFVQNLADRQIGVVARVDLNSTVTETSGPDIVQDVQAGQTLQLVFEWHSQNGSLLADVVCSQLDRVEEDADLQNQAKGIDGGQPLDSLDDDYAEIVLEENRNQPPDHDDLEEELDEDSEEEEEDPYGLFETDIDEAVSESLADDRSDRGGTGKSKAWQDSAEALDPETRAMYEQWDEIFEGKKDQPISYLFRKTLRLPRPEAVKSDSEAEEYIREILAQLALLSVALDVCEHFTAIDTYRLLMNEILPTAKVHPNLAASEMVQHYSTSDHCQACEAEFDADYRPPSETDPEGGLDDGMQR